jgi:hypothetical protein
MGAADSQRTLQKAFVSAFGTSVRAMPIVYARFPVRRRASLIE